MAKVIYDTSTGFLIEGSFYYTKMNLYYTFELKDTNAKIIQIFFDHDIKAVLNVPKAYEVGTPSNIEAIITNLGDHIETNVEALLYLNGNIVENRTISNLPKNSIETIIYNWIPLEYGDQNFTISVVPKEGEIYRENNIMTKILTLKDLIFFDGMYLKYSYYISWFTPPERSRPVILEYTQLDCNLYNIYWTEDCGSITLYGLYDLDIYTRKTSNPINFERFKKNSHTPFWIFPDVSLGDHVLIGLYFDGDHILNVSRIVYIDIPGFNLSIVISCIIISIAILAIYRKIKSL